MAKADGSVTINQPIDQVFDYLVTNYPSNLQKWSPAVQQIQQTTPGPISIGTIFSQVRTVQGKPVAANIEVTDFQSMQRFALRGQGAEQVIQVTYTLAPVGHAATSVAVAIDLEGGFPRLAAPMVGRQIKKEIEEDLDRLKGQLGG